MPQQLPPTSDPTWVQALGQNFLEAALQCGFVCERTFVSPRRSPEGLAPDCPCQLAVFVQPGYQGTPAGDPPPCLPRPIARVTMIADFCVAEADEGSVLTPVQLSMDAARVNEALWRISAGIQKSRYHGGLADGDCSTVLPGSWQQIDQQGASVRYTADYTVLLTPT